MNSFDGQVQVLAIVCESLVVDTTTQCCQCCHALNKSSIIELNPLRGFGGFPYLARLHWLSWCLVSLQCERFRSLIRCSTANQAPSAHKAGKKVCVRSSLRGRPPVSRSLLALLIAQHTHTHTHESREPGKLEPLPVRAHTQPAFPLAHHSFMACLPASQASKLALLQSPSEDCSRCLSLSLSLCWLILTPRPLAELRLS